jgi:lysosomal acid phosphatase
VILYWLIMVLKVSYRNSSTHDPYLLHVPGCDSVACDLDQFISVVKPLLVTNWYEECQKDPENNFFIYISKIL